MLNIDGKLLDKLDENEYYLFSILLNYGKKSRPDNGVLMHRTGWGLQKVQNTKKSLINKGFIEVNARFNRDDKSRGRASNEYKIKTPLCSKYNGVQLYDFNVIEIQLDDFQAYNKVLKLSVIENIKLLKQDNKERENYIKEIESLKKQLAKYEKEENIEGDFLTEVKDILEFFINTTGKNIRIGKTDSLISRSDKYKNIVPRLQEGATVEECKKIIELKSKQWKGDKVMDSSLCIETLFRRSKFLKYLDEIDNTQSKGIKKFMYDLPTFRDSEHRQSYFLARYETYKQSGQLDNYLVNTEYRQRAIYKQDAEGLCFELELQTPELLELEFNYTL